MGGDRVVLFGAGKYGRIALNEIGKERVKYFIDNSKHKQRDLIEGKSVYPVEHVVEVKEQDCIMICGMSHMTMIRQLADLGISNYKVFHPLVHYYPTSELIYNPYETESDRDVDEESWIKLSRSNNVIEYISEEVNYLVDNMGLFSHIEIETINRCNGNCDFCPASSKNDKRKKIVMAEGLFRKIIDELAEINYEGRLALFSNNEPFLDPDIVERHRYARKRLPKAKMHLFTNGTLISLEEFIEIVQYLDELIIDNYQQDLKLIKTNNIIADYCMTHEELKRKVTIVLRKPSEILTTRGGVAPNRKIIESFTGTKCTLPFKQMIIRPDGKISLCCNDAWGRMTLGDLNKQSVLEAWNSREFQLVRRALSQGREKIDLCKSCDYFAIG